MTFLEIYQNLSNYSLYKQKIFEVGINSLLVFNLDGIPFMARDYSSDNVRTSQDFIFLSAFISSILKFIKVEGNNTYLTDFGIGTSRFYLRFDSNQTIYCLVLNELIHRRITGDELISFVESTTFELQKAFNFYNRDSNGILKKQKFDEQFCLKLDRIFLRFYDQFISKTFNNLQKRDYLFDETMVQSIKSGGLFFAQNLTDFGIKGLLICGGRGDTPVVIRNYEKNSIQNDEGGFFLCGLSNILNKFALNNFGFFTDVGFGFQRVIFKFKTDNRITLCLVLAETIYKRVTGETLNIFSELMLKRVHKSIKVFLPDLNEITLDTEIDPNNNELIHTLDGIMFENAMNLFNEFQN